MEIRVESARKLKFKKEFKNIRVKSGSYALFYYFMMWKWSLAPTLRRPQFHQHLCEYNHKEAIILIVLHSIPWSINATSNFTRAHWLYSISSFRLELESFLEQVQDSKCSKFWIFVFDLTLLQERRQDESRGLWVKWI